MCEAPHSKSTLGYQSDNTDEDTGNLLLGPRLYDPEVNRFTSPDVFAAGGADMALGTDPLTGNRFMFAAANPVGFYEDGHRPERKMCARTYCSQASPANFQSADREASKVIMDEVQMSRTCSGDMSRMYQACIAFSSRFGNPGGSGETGGIVLDIIGLIPLLGDAVDAGCCGKRVVTRQFDVDSGLTCASVVPIAGTFATTAKWGNRARSLGDVATTPVGRKGLSSGLNVTARNTPTTIAGRSYPGHAIDQLQARGLVPSVVQDAITYGTAIPSRGGTSIYYSSVNNVSVVVNETGQVVTVGHGHFKP